MQRSAGSSVISKACSLLGFRQLRTELTRRAFLHLTLVPYIAAAGELKTKPTQHSVKELQGHGIRPDVLICRSQAPMRNAEKAKLPAFAMCESAVIQGLDVDTIYAAPLTYHEEGWIAPY